MWFLVMLSVIDELRDSLFLDFTLFLFLQVFGSNELAPQLVEGCKHIVLLVTTACIESGFIVKLSGKLGSVMVRSLRQLLITIVELVIIEVMSQCLIEFIISLLQVLKRN